jgi:hypothetical protein
LLHPGEVSLARPHQPAFIGGKVAPTGDVADQFGKHSGSRQPFVWSKEGTMAKKNSTSGINRRKILTAAAAAVTASGVAPALPGIDAARIAKGLKRTVGATRQKAFSLGVSLDSRA